MSMPIGVHSIITWQLGGPSPCSKCLSLAGKTWIDYDLFAPTLDDPLYGPIYDLNADMSLAHPNCFCGIMVEVMVNLAEIPGLNPLEGEVAV